MRRRLSSRFEPVTPRWFVCLLVCVFVCCRRIGRGQAGSAVAAVSNFGTDLRDCRALTALLEVGAPAPRRRTHRWRAEAHPWVRRWATGNGLCVCLWRRSACSRCSRRPPQRTACKHSPTVARTRASHGCCLLHMSQRAACHVPLPRSVARMEWPGGGEGARGSSADADIPLLHECFEPRPVRLPRAHIPGRSRREYPPRRPCRLPPTRATSHAAATRFWPAGSVRHVAASAPVRQRRGTVQYSEHRSLGKSPSAAPRSVVMCCFVFPELVRARGAARPDRSLSEQVRAAAPPTPLRPHRHRDSARHICTGTGPAAATSAPGLLGQQPRVCAEWCAVLCDGHRRR